MAAIAELVLATGSDLQPPAPAATPGTIVTPRGTPWSRGTTTQSKVASGAPLRQSADQLNLRFGAQAVADPSLPFEYWGVLSREFNHVLSDGELGFNGRLRPSRDSFNFSLSDTLVDFAEKNQMSVEAHHLVWGGEEYIPDPLYVAPAWLTGGNFSRDELFSILKDHIRELVTHYKGRVNVWTAVNEAVLGSNPANSRKGFWLERFGQDYFLNVVAPEVFRLAKSIDPAAVLLLNEDPDVRYASNLTSIFNYVKWLKDNRIPVDGVGLQMHIKDATVAPTKQQLLSVLRMLSALVPVYLTELDVNISRIQGTQQVRWQRQAQIYGDVLGACLESGVVRGFTMFGFTDRISWYDGMGYSQPDALLFDRDYNPKPAYYTVQDMLQQWVFRGSSKTLFLPLVVR